MRTNLCLEGTHLQYSCDWGKSQLVHFVVDLRQVKKLLPTAISSALVLCPRDLTFNACRQSSGGAINLTTQRHIISRNERCYTPFPAIPS